MVGVPITVADNICRLSKPSTRAVAPAATEARRDILRFMVRTPVGCRRRTRRHALGVARHRNHGFSRPMPPFANVTHFVTPPPVPTLPLNHPNS